MVHWFAWKQVKRNGGITVKWREQQQKSSLSDFETLQKTKIFGEQTAAARNDVTAKTIVSGLLQNLLADGPKTGLLAARAISKLQSSAVTSKPRAPHVSLVSAYFPTGEFLGYPYNQKRVPVRAKNGGHFSNAH